MHMVVTRQKVFQSLRVIVVSLSHLNLCLPLMMKLMHRSQLVALMMVLLNWYVNV